MSWLITFETGNLTEIMCCTVLVFFYSYWCYICADKNLRLNAYSDCLSMLCLLAKFAWHYGSCTFGCFRNENCYILVRSLSTLNPSLVLCLCWFDIINDNRLQITGIQICKETKEREWQRFNRDNIWGIGLDWWL